MTRHWSPPPTTATDRGFTLVELLITLGITTLILGGTMTALGNAVRITDATTQITGLNTTLRSGMDLMVRDILQSGQGLPSGRVITLPSGAGSQPIRLPGPPSTAFLPAASAYTYTGTSFCPPPAALCGQVSAVIPGAGRGPAVLAGQPTDTITVLESDGTFVRPGVGADPVRLTAFAADGSSITIEAAVNITDGGANDVDPGDLLMLTKGSISALVQVSRITAQQVFFDAADSLLLNQPAAAAGRLVDLRNAAPADVIVLPATTVTTTATRIRMVSYYLDVTTDALHPRLVRRINNNGNATAFNVAPDKTVVAFDIDNLQFAYDLSDGSITRSGVRMTVADLQGTGACAPSACSPNQIRKVRILLSARSRIPMRGTRQFFRNRLITQVTLRSLSFADRYR